MITVKSPRELELMADAGKIVGDVLAMLKTRVVAGVSTWDLDREAEAFIRGHSGAKPSFNPLRRPSPPRLYLFLPSHRWFALRRNPLPTPLNN